MSFTFLTVSQFGFICCFLMIRFQLHIFVRNPAGSNAEFLVHHIWWLTILICPITDEVNFFKVNFYHLRSCLPGFCAVKLTNYFVCTNRYFGGEILRLHKYPPVIKLLSASFSMLQMLPNGDFSNSIIPSTGIS